MELNRITSYTESFNAIVQHIEGENGEKVEVWFARDLQSRLGYARWENFQVAICRAVDSCKSQNISIDDHFREVTKMVVLGSGAQREIQDYMLTRFACYLIAQNGDPKKEEIAFAQGYFALQTRRAELISEHMDNNRSVRQMLSQRGIKPEELPPSEDIKKIERRVTSNEKKIEKTSSKLPPRNND